MKYQKWVARAARVCGSSTHTILEVVRYLIVSSFLNSLSERAQSEKKVLHCYTKVFR